MIHCQLTPCSDSTKRLGQVLGKPHAIVCTDTQCKHDLNNQNVCPADVPPTFHQRCSAVEADKVVVKRLGKRHCSRSKDPPVFVKVNALIFLGKPDPLRDSQTTRTCMHNLDSKLPPTRNHLQIPLDVQSTSKRSHNQMSLGNQAWYEKRRPIWQETRLPSKDTSGIIGGCRCSSCQVCLGVHPRGTGNMLGVWGNCCKECGRRAAAGAQDMAGLRGLTGTAPAEAPHRAYAAIYCGFENGG